MATLKSIREFLAQKHMAVVGVSRDERKFGRMAFRELRKKDYALYPVHPSMESADGEKCFPDLASLPGEVTAVLVITPPAATAGVVEAAAERGIRHLWIQQGAESPEAVELAQQRGLNCIHGRCILMFAEPTGFGHRLHRGIVKLIGRFPK